MNERSIFIEALDIADLSQRAAYLERACGNDADLRRRVERLLRANGQAGGFMNASAADRVGISDERQVTERPGMTIGSYQLLEQIGEGGFGLVFVAEQQEPVRRKVAMKILKPGMDTRQVVARFEAERQALAMMDHPNIATVHDGGATPSGRPYFVMELVRGVPITEFCDQNHLSPRQRLELFVPVCQAVQHAHQKGVIHRDLKPSNILVAMHDTTPVPKVIDFGVAKSLGPVLTDETIFTGFAQMIGTPLYMSPEQAGQSGLDIDTRSDIYSLGVLLYELLTGTTPFDKQRFQQAAYDEIRRIVREEDPPRPSTRLSELSSRLAPRAEAASRNESTTLASVAAQRHTEPAKLTKLVRGELDWIVMKALEKDRNRRYETADGFATDVRRYLADQPVSAAPPTMGYRFRKFVRRNRRALILTGVIGCAVFLTLGAVGWAVYDRSAREGEVRRDQLARRARVGGQFQVILDDVARLEREQRWPEALIAARRASDLLAGGDADPEMADRVRDSIRDLELVRLLEDVRASTSEFRVSSFDVRGAAERYAVAFRDGGLDLDGLTFEEGARQLRSRPAVMAALVPFLHDWATCRHRTGDTSGAENLWNVVGLVEPDPWRQTVRQAILNADVQEVLTLAASPDLDRQPAATFTDLGQYLRRAGQVDLAIAVLLRARHQHPADFWVHFELGSAFDKKGRSGLEQAAGCYRTAVALRPRNPTAWNNLGNVLRRQNRPADAIACYQKAIDLDPKHAMAHANLGLALQEQGKSDEAIACLRKAIEVYPEFFNAHVYLGFVHRARGQLPEAVAAYRKALELDPNSALADCNLGMVLADQMKLSDATAAYQKAIELDSKFASAYHGLGIALRAQKKLPEAVRALQKAVELDPNSPIFYTTLGVALHDQNNLPGAVSCHRKAIELDPKFAPAHSNLGTSLLAQNDLPGAIAAYGQAVALDPTNPAIQDNYRQAVRKLGVNHLNQGRADDAIACFRKVIDLDARDALAHTYLGVALSRKGLPDEAAAAFREALRVKPDHADALSNYARLLATPVDAKGRNPAEAAKLAKKAVELSPGSGNAWNTLGIAQYRAGEWKDALAALEKSMGLRQGGDANDWFFVAMTHWRLDKKDEARKWYDRAAQWMAKNAPQNPDLRRFRAEAAELLGVKE